MVHKQTEEYLTNYPAIKFILPMSSYPFLVLDVSCISDMILPTAPDRLLAAKKNSLFFFRDEAETQNQTKNGEKI